MKIVICGARGRMGRRITALARERGLEVVAGIENEGHPDVDKTVEGVKITSDLECIKECDCIIDFSRPEATERCLGYASKYGKNMVIGTTGLDERVEKKIKEASSSTGIVYSPNMSIGVNVLFRLIKIAASVLKNYRAEVGEAHHIHKKDAPSGTAKRIAQLINGEGIKLGIDEIKAVREDEIVGDHEVRLESDVDTLTLKHSAKTRDIFAKGALEAAGWLSGKDKGLYSMDDVLFNS
ncbi:MAG: 4-hydroxy-tetrahydrodipicolinate reductase [Candidatus Omnitrophica bacterium]|nr:4-hydroxy-tetrahydrodipicolinate reductase [Candidatus Omnitrophota bacterium]MBD3268568.1 4-hydroxy-tetrahydrodipicolinate reductase [Candidatus Omnitrophota bacterium]